MTRNRFWSVASILGAVVLGCAPPEPAIDLEAERQALRSAADAYHEAGRSRDVEKIVSYYTNESRTLAPNSPDEIGKDGFRKIATAMVALPGFEARFGNVQADVSASGDMGYTLADMEMSFQGPQGEMVQEKLRDFHVWKKEADGSWKIAFDIWNSTEPVAVPE